MLRLPAEFFEKRHVGDILSRIGAVQPIQDAITRGVVARIIDGVMALIAAGDPVLLFGDAGAIVVFAVLLHLGLVFALYPGHAAPDGGGDSRPRQGTVAPHGDGAGGDHHQADGPRGRARERMAQPLCAEVTNAGISVGKYQISFDVHPDAALPAWST